MVRISENFLAAVAGLGLMIFSAPAYSQQGSRDTAPRAQLTPAQAANAQTRRAIRRINGDLVAILNAVLWDPSLTAQLSASPASGQTILRARGAFRSERIVVEKAGTTSITITLSVGNVRTVLSL